MLDELNDDITFLSFALINNDVTPLHTKYLEAFYEEEFDEDSALASTQKRPTIARQQIYAYLARQASPPHDQSTVVETLRSISKLYSGYVHGASPHIMDMYVGQPRKFQVAGMLGTEAEDAHRQELTNFFHRTLAASGFASIACGDAELSNQVSDFAKEFHRRLGLS
ncbi:hypothetical protein [Polaromonas sp.]|uniref:hypothetical protein n=1 Tax=Polaromonas sp. TaxID=1869339 RepID=UPI001840AE4F|nr:hypothetical protein [Polaromonas sp.]NML84288.1 hypothetical protein [Polaromonas sp.]